MDKEITARACSDAVEAVFAYLEEKDSDLIPLKLLKALATLTKQWLQNIPRQRFILRMISFSTG